MATKKKGFTSANPALDFISRESIEKVDGPTEPKEEPVKRATAPEGYKPGPEYVETKSRRVQILIQPSVHEAVKAKARAEGISTNEAINQALREYTEK